MPSYYPYDDPMRDEAYMACGKIATAWGPVELAIEMAIVLLRNRQKAPVKDHAFIDFPVSFSRKAKELTARLKDDSPLFDDLRPNVATLLDEGGQIHERRTIVCHSSFQGVGGKNGRDLIFIRSEQRRGHSAVWKYLTFERLEADFRRMPVLASEFTSLVDQIRERGLGKGAPPYARPSPNSHHTSPRCE